MIAKLFKSLFFASILALAACAHRKPQPSPDTQTPAAQSQTEVPAASAPTEKPALPPPSAADALDDGPHIELKQKDAPTGKAIEITDAQRAAVETKPELKSPGQLATEAKSSTDMSQASAETNATIEAATKAGAAEGKTEAAAEGKAKPSLNEATSSAVEVSGVEPNQSLRWLQNGNKRFVKNWLRKDGQSMKDVQRLAHSQRPHAIVLSCSDSRVPPEIVFDQKLGELFVVRTAGETADADAVASIEYAVTHLGTRLLLVMGHTSCGFVKAAIQTLDGTDAGSPSLNHVVAKLHPSIREIIGPDGKASKGYQREEWAVTHGVVADILKQSDVLKAAVEKGQLLIKTSLYHLDSGVVDFE